MAKHVMFQKYLFTRKKIILFINNVFDSLQKHFSHFNFTLFAVGF